MFMTPGANGQLHNRPAKLSTGSDHVLGDARLGPSRQVSPGQDLGFDHLFDVDRIGE